MHVLVLGGYGFIGLEAARRLQARRRRVTALGRSAKRGARVLPDAQWLAADIAELTSPEQWAPLLQDVDVVVNASGALQDGLRDNLAAVQSRAICALIAACEPGNIRFVQISAPGAHADSDTAFLRTKAVADTALKASAIPWIILRPGLVWGRNATGGTALVRMLSAFPWIQPLVLTASRVQTIDIDDVCSAIVAAVEGDIPTGTDADLVEPTPLSLSEIVTLVRTWHGFPVAVAHLELPSALGALLARLGDLSGWLGWRSPLRTTSLRALEAGVIGDADKWRALSGMRIASLGENLKRRPATRQDRLFARAQLLLPLVVIVLSAFWVASGVIGAIRIEAAAAVLGGAGEPAKALVAAGATADILLGLAILWRPWARAACLAMIVLTGFYLMAGTALTPQLWADPLGPFVKTIPAALLALVGAALLEER